MVESGNTQHCFICSDEVSAEVSVEKLGYVNWARPGSARSILPNGIAD